MNKGLFRLIFSIHLGMFVPAAESVVTCAGRSSGSSARSRRRALAVLLAAAMHGTPVMAAQPAGLVQHATLGWTNANIASSSTSQMTIQQTAPKAILNWKQLNLNRGETLTFNQGGNRTWAALNRIYDANPSLISGNVKADGHIYFVNSNGIIFGDGAQINVGSLTASSLDVTDDLFNSGTLSNNTSAVFSGEKTGYRGFILVDAGAHITTASGGRVLLLAPDNAVAMLDGSGNPVLKRDANGNPVVRLDMDHGVPRVDADGNPVLDANNKPIIDYPPLVRKDYSGNSIVKVGVDGNPIKDADGNNVYEYHYEYTAMQDAAGNALSGVVNKGVITTPDGQTILAAGKKIYLAESADPAGLLVEVDAGGTAKNLGEIVAQRGNVTLVGLAVNQEGRISASTSVRANGSIHLLARDTVAVKTVTNAVTKDVTYEPEAHRGGVVTLGKNSTTTIDVETGDKEEVLDVQKLNSSRVKISGGVINIEGSIVAHGGEVSATAAFNPSLPDETDKSNEYAVDATRIYLGKNALIDVSGIDARAPMSRNQLEIQLYSDQLKDAPLQRGGPLFGKVIYVDAGKGTALTDIKPYLALKGKTIAERLASGGTVNLAASSGDVVLSAGSELNVSGGSVTYEPGYMKESILSYQGKLVAVSQADPNIPYQALADTYSVTDAKWGGTRTWYLNSGTQTALDSQGAYNASYSAGSDAGKINVKAANAFLQADLKAVTQPGVTQRESLPAGGAFNFTQKNNGTGVAPIFRVVTENPGTVPDTFSVVGSYDADAGKFARGSVLTNADILLDNKLFANGFSKFDLNSSGTIVVDAAIRTVPKGSVTLKTAGQAIVNADIVSPGGTIEISGGDTKLADHVTVSASGLYTNDTPDVGGVLAVDGGSVGITEKDTDKGGLTLGDSVVIKADAGAWLKPTGKLSGGKGGSVTLSGLPSLGNADVSAFGFSKGGSLTLNAFGNIQAGGKNLHASGTLWLPEAFFGKGGFAKYTMATSLPDSNVLIGDAAGKINTKIHPQTQLLVAKGGYGALSSGADMENVAGPELPADGLRAPASVKFKSMGTLKVAKNAIVETDAPSSGSGGSIALEAGGQLSILGSLIAPAGKISATITGGIAGFPFDNKLSLFLGESSRLLATGYYAVPPSFDGNRANAKVLNGGTITLDGGDRGVVVAKQGSLLDVSGVSGQADITGSNGYTRKTLYGSAGDINISSRNALVLDGDLHGDATGTGAGGTLNLNITGSTSIDPSNVHPDDARTLTVTQDKINRANALNPGKALDSVIGQGAISAEQIDAGGFDRLSLSVGLGVSGDKIVLSDGLDLSLPAALTLDAPLLEASGFGTAQVAAPHITLTNSKNAAAPAPITGDATLDVYADFIDLINSVAVTGVTSTNLYALKDIRVRGNQIGVAGSLLVPGELVLSARQIYPSTNSSKFQFEAIGAGSSIKVQSSGEVSTPVLSAGGELTLKADEIEQGGALRAPMGTITLDAANKLTLDAGSLTSVSTGGLLIPYGLTGLGGLDWFKPSELVASDSAGIVALPEKKINLKSADVKLQAGATVDISGGGDVLAYEFIKGIGGTQDVLGQAGVYAVMPVMRGEYAPFDYSYNKIIDPDITTNSEASATIAINTDLKPGDAVYLSAVPGLDAGTYTLLPGRYALLPGAFMVQTDKPQLMQGQSVAQLDGSTLVSGYRTTLADTTTNLDTRWSTFKVTDGSIFRPAAGTRSKASAEYRLTTGNQFFQQLALDEGVRVPRLAADAGQLTLDASASLTLDATILTGKASGARGAVVDITSDKLSVVSAIGADDGTLQLTAGSLNALNAESLLLGGTRTLKADEITITTNASTVIFANDADHALEATEVIAAAKDTLTVNSGAAISALKTTQPAGNVKLHASGDGALLAVSALSDIEFDRASVSADPVLGTLDVMAGANIQAKRSLVLDSILASTLNGNVDVDAGGTATLGASRILLGDSGNETGLKLDNKTIANLGDVAKLTLNSRKNIDIYGPVSFGNSNLNLTVNAGGIAAHPATDQPAPDHLADSQVVTLTANNFELKNSAGATYVPPDVAGVASRLDVNAHSITFEGKTATNTIDNAGNTTIGGFDTVNLNATGDVIFKGAGSTKIQSSQTNITSTRISAATGTDYELAATGALNTAKATATDTLSYFGGLGAKLKMIAASIGLGGNVELPSGQFNAQATQGDLTVSADAKIKAASAPVNFNQFTQYTPGGTIALQADMGNVNVNAGAEIDVSGGSSANAGTLKISAKEGQTTVAGLLKGHAAAGKQAGSFVLDSKVLSDFSGLNTLLNDGGFTRSREMRIRSGDVKIAAGDTVVAQQFVLSADAGKIDVAGTVDASGTSGGAMELYAKNDLTLQQGGKLLARGNGDSTVKGDGKGSGGSVLLSSESGTVSAEVFEVDGVTRLAAAALIDVSGDQAGGVKGAAGQVTLRAVRTGTDNSDFKPVAATVYNPVTGTVYNSVAATVATTAGVSTISATVSGFALADGKIVAFKPGTQPTGTPKLKIGSLGAKSILKSDGTALAAASEIKSGQVNFAVYDSAKDGFKLISNNAGSTVAATVSGLTSLMDGSVVAFKPNANPADIPKLYVNGLGVVNLYKSNGSVAAKADLVKDKVGYAVYDKGLDKGLGGFKLISGDAGSTMTATVSGLANPASLTRGDVVAFTPSAKTSEAPKLYLNGLVLAGLQKAGGTVAATTDLIPGKTYLAVYDGTNFQLVSGDANGLLANGSGAVGTGVNIAADVPAAVIGAGVVRLEAVRTYEKTALDTKAQLQIAADNQAFYSRANTVLAGYKPTQDRVAATLSPGVEVRSSEGDLTVSNDWNLDTASNGTLSMAGAGTLTLRAAGNLKINGSLSDGFVTPAIDAAKAARSAAIAARDANNNPASEALVNAITEADSAIELSDAVLATDTPAVKATKLQNALTKSKAALDLAKADLDSVKNADMSELIAAADAVSNFDAASAGIASDRSWSYRLAAKADLNAVNPMATIKSEVSDNLALASNKLIRTGTGDIRIAAGGDMVMGNDSSVIYTAGQAADGLVGFADPAASLKPLFLSNGGDIKIDVMGNIVGKLGSNGNQQLITHWLFRQGGGSSNKSVSWWVRPDLFKQGVAAFGGGDVSIQADGDISNFSASVPTTGRYDRYTVTTTTDPDTGAIASTNASAGSGNHSIVGGGNLLVRAGGDIKSGVYYAGRGDIRLTAGGEIGKSSNTFGTTLALQDASAEVSAAKSAFIETVFNPTLWAQATANASQSLDTTGNNSFFLTYGANSAFHLESLTGDVTLGLANTGNITGDLASGLNGTSAKPALEVHPAAVEATAFGGNINVGRLVLAPAAKGNLSLLATGDVKSFTNGLIAMSDADLKQFPGVTNPLANSGLLPDLINQLRTTHAGIPVHLGDEQPLVIVARDGSISLVGDIGTSTTKGPGLSSPKAAFIQAGLDISLNADLQHLSSNDITVVEAGRDFASTTKVQQLLSGKVQLSGPGELLLQAGRNVSLGKSQGIVTAANTTNSALSAEGASITVLAGLGKEGANLADYISAYINPTGSGPAVLQGDSGKLAEYRQQTAQAVAGYMRKLSGNDGLSDKVAVVAQSLSLDQDRQNVLPDTDTMAQFLALDQDRQAVFAYRHFSSELLSSGKGFKDSRNHNRGDNAIAMLFPADRMYDGDLVLFNSQLRTKRDGSIDILTPGGFINAGVPTSGGENIGIVTEKGGDIRAFAETGFQVEQSRVITQYGSDITVWVNNGDIDAGRGSKTAVSVPERVVSTDKDGNTIIEVKGASAGSGIRAQTYDLDGPNGAGKAPKLGAVALIAPRGVLDAGEAGIVGGEGSFYWAPEFRNENNFESPNPPKPVDTGSLAGSLAGISNLPPTGAGMEEAVRQVAQSANNPFTQTIMPSYITVDVIGLGE